MNHIHYLAELDMSGTNGPLIFLFLITFLLMLGISILWLVWRTPARIEKKLSKESFGMLDLKSYLCVSGWDYLWSFLISSIFIIATFTIFFYTLNKSEYTGLPFWVWLTSSKMRSMTVFGAFHPMPYGVLLALFLGLFIGRVIGISVGKKLGAKRVLLVSRIHDPVKF